MEKDLANRDEGYADRLANFVYKLRFEDIPPQALHRAKLCVLDTLGIILGAVSFNHSRHLISYVRSLSHKEQATVLGFKLKTSVQEAAFATGSLAELLELQDGGWRGNHPSSVVIPAALALGEAHGISGREFLTAVVAGYDVANRICGAIHPSHQMRGFTPTSTGGTFGAAAAAGKILGFDKELHVNCLGIAGFLLPISLNETLWKGCSIKLIHAGQAAKTGIESALLAREGFTGWEHILGSQSPDSLGFCNITATNPDFTKITEGLGKDFTIQGGYFKAYPCCRLTHGAIDAVLRILDQAPIQAPRIRKIHVNTFSLAFKKVGQNYTTPGSSLFECQFSLPYVVASTVLNTRFGIEQLSESAIADHAIHDLASLVTVSENPLFSNSFPKTRSTEIELVLDSGESMRHRVDFTKGDPEWPLTEDELLMKFKSLTSYTITQELIERAVTEIMHLEQLSNIRELVRSLTEGLISNERLSLSGDERH